MGEWKTMPLGSLGAESPSAFATGPFGSAVSAENFQESGIPMIRGSNLSGEVGVRLNDADVVFVPEELAAKYARSMVAQGDIIFTCWGTVGQVGLIDGSARYQRYLVSNKQMKMTPDSARMSSLYLYYYLSQPSMVALVRGQSIGSSVPGFNLGQLKELPVAVPSLDEQRAIADVLGALDDKIAANNTLHDLSKALLAALFSELGVDDGFEMLLSELVEFNPRSALLRDDNAPYLDMKNLPSGAMTVSEWSYRTPQGGARFRDGDTLLARITPCLENGKLGIVDFLNDDETGVGSTEFIVMRPRDDVPIVFPYLLALTPRFRDYAIRRMVGTSGRQRLSWSDLADYRVGRLDTAALKRLSSMGGALLPRIKAAVDESRRLAAVRDELLPLLMSGQVRVRDAEKAVEEVV